MRLPRRIFFLLALSVGAFASGASADAELPMRDFLLRARRSNPIATYARLDGSLQHRRRGRDGIEEMPIYFGVILHPDRTVGQLILDGNEAYLLGQGKGVGVTSISRMPGGTPSDKLGYVGVRAGDLMLSFLFCRPLRELEGETLRGIVPCRVFELDDPSNKETVKVWISREHAFPLRAEFTRYGENAPFRELEAGALTKKNDLYYIRQIRLSGPGWSTRIDFDADRAEIAPLPASGSARIFRKLPSK